MQATDWHGRPVADGGHVELGCGAIAGDELAGGLQGIEDACGGVGGKSNPILIGNYRIAFGVHCGRGG